MSTLKFARAKAQDALLCLGRGGRYVEEQLCSDINAFKAKIGSALDADCRIMIRGLMSAFKEARHFDQMTFRILLQSADEVRAQIISEYSSSDKQISIWSDDEAVDNVVTAFRQAINRGQSGPDLAGAVCNSIIANQPLELTGHRNRSPDATAADNPSPTGFSF